LGHKAGLCCSREVAVVVNSNNVFELGNSHLLSVLEG